MLEPSAQAIKQARGQGETSASADTFDVTIEPSPLLIICGGGADAVPLANMAKLMEWQVHVMEARSHFAKQHQFIGVDSIIRGPFEEKSPQLFEHIDAIVCMSHHVGYDAKALLWALQTSSPYIGLLGPAHRTDKVLQAANIEREHFGDKLHNPVGLNIGGDTPEAIALSILAEIQASISAKRSSAIPSS